jgi:lipopolysaccharide transport system permease protein
MTLVRHDVSALYSGAVLSILWAVVTPLVTLSVYSFVFGYILDSSFTRGGTHGGHFVFALGLFNGLIIWDFFSSVVSQSPRAITSKPNYVKKIVFPVEILPVVQVGSSLFQFLLCFIILLVAIALSGSPFFWRSLLIPCFLVPVLLYAIGFSWFLSSLGVFFRDVANAINPLLQIVWFGSAIFFPIASVPAPFQPFFYMNPLAACIEESRRFAILSQPTNVGVVSLHLLVGWLVACFGLYFFRKTQRSFADVL